MLATLKNKRMFAVFNATEHNICKAQAFFCAEKLLGYQTPIFRLPCLQCSCSVAGTEGDSLSLLNNFNFI